MVKITIERFATLGEALAAETKAISEEGPVYNIRNHVMRVYPTSLEEAIQILKRDIESGVYKPGEWLPPGMRLAPLLGVSPPTFTKALKALDKVGLVEFHPNYGATVSNRHKQ